MPTLDINVINSSLKNRDIKEFPTFIETGTMNGRTIFSMSEHFDVLHTIEIQAQLYQNVIEKYKRSKFNNINFHLGDSSIILPKILPHITNKSIIFLDGHFSNFVTAKGISIGRGDKDVPIYEELSSIVSLHKDECIIIIDDARLFGTNKNDENWSDINEGEILNIANNRLVDSFYLESPRSTKDRLVIHLSAQTL